MNPDYQTGSVQGQAKDAAAKLTEQVRDTSSDVTQRATQTARTAVDNQKGRVTEGMGAVADALHQTAEHLDDQDQGGIARFAHMAADRLDDFSNDLQNKSVDEMIGEVERFARREPGLFLGGALMLGLLASRFLKSSASRSQQNWQQNYGRSGYGQGFGQGSYGGSYATGGNYGAGRRYNQQDLADYRRETLDSEYTGQSGSSSGYQSGSSSGYSSGATGRSGTGSGMTGAGTTGTGSSGASTLGPETPTGPTSTTSPGTGTGSTSQGFNTPPSTKPGEKPGNKPPQRTGE